MHRISKNIIGAFGIGIISLVYLYGAAQVPFGSARAPGAGFMPVITAVIMLGLCIFNIGKELLLPVRDRVKEEKLLAGDKPSESVNIKRPLKLIAVILIYPIFLVNLGFTLSTIALIYITLRLMEYRTWWLSLLLAIVIILLVNYIFGNVFGVMLPSGIFG